MNESCPHCHRPLEPEGLLPNPLVLPLDINMANALDFYDALRTIADQELPANGCTPGTIQRVSTGHSFVWTITTEYREGELGRNEVTIGAWEFLRPDGQPSGLLFNSIEL